MSEEEYRAWVEASEIDQRAAEVTLQAGLFSTCVFHCQQTIEKRLKAMIAYAGKPKFSHSVTELAETLLGQEAVIPEEIYDALAELDLHYIHSRYPGITSLKKLYSEKKAKEAIKWMQKILQYLESLHMM